MDRGIYYGIIKTSRLMGVNLGKRNLSSLESQQSSRSYNCNKLSYPNKLAPKCGHVALWKMSLAKSLTIGYDRSMLVLIGTKLTTHSHFSLTRWYRLFMSTLANLNET